MRRAYNMIPPPPPFRWRKDNSKLRSSLTVFAKLLPRYEQVTPEIVDQLSKPLKIYLYVGPYVEPEKPEVGSGMGRRARYFG